jgi:hypothetical protein
VALRVGVVVASRLQMSRDVHVVVRKERIHAVLYIV